MSAAKKPPPRADEPRLYRPVTLQELGWMLTRAMRDHMFRLAKALHAMREERR